MKRADLILGVSVIAVCVVLFLARAFFREEGASVVVEVEGEAFGTYALDQDQEIDIGDGNHIQIENGTVRMTYANCPDHLCVNQGKIKADGEMIVCLPNRVVVQVSDENAEVSDDVPDLIAQ